MKSFLKFSLIPLILLIFSENVLGAKYPFWKNVKFGLEYKRGICRCSKYLEEKETGGFFPDFYNLNSIEASILIMPSVDHGYKLGFEYGWTNLKNRVGLPPKRDVNDWGELLSIIETSDEWDIRKYSYSFEKISKSFFSVGLELTYANARVTENYYRRDEYYNLILTRSAKVNRGCLGLGGFLRFSLRKKVNENFNIYPFCLLKWSASREFYYDSPWEWNEILSISFSGIYAGIKISNGGL